MWMLPLNLHVKRKSDDDEDRNHFPKLLPLASRLGAVMNPQKLKLHTSRINFHSPKDVQAIEVQLNISAAALGMGIQK